MKHKKLKKKDIDNQIATFCYEVIKNPLLYFSEADLQQLLTEKLKTISPLNYFYPTSVPKGPKSNTTYTTSLLHREYAAGGRRRIDIVIFNDKKIKYNNVDVLEINNPELKINNKYVKIDYGFELGTEKTPINKTAEHLAKDIEKLIQCNKNGYIIHFLKDITKSKKNKKDIEGRREERDKLIKNKFKKVFEEQLFTKSKNNSNLNNLYLPNTNKIKIIAVVLKIYRPGEKIIGKCEIFNINNKRFEAVNINNKEKIKNSLKLNLK